MGNQRGPVLGHVSCSVRVTGGRGLTSDTSTPHWVVSSIGTSATSTVGSDGPTTGWPWCRCCSIAGTGNAAVEPRALPESAARLTRRRSTLPRRVSASHRLVQRTETHDVVRGRVPRRRQLSAVPGSGFEFELPRFGELPARLNLSVFHLPSESHRVKHFVEADAFAPPDGPSSRAASSRASPRAWKPRIPPSASRADLRTLTGPGRRRPHTVAALRGRPTARRPVVRAVPVDRRRLAGDRSPPHAP